ncbi:hypothetical protein J4N42_20190 [Vibrio sp. SCSIO 43135]|uniref:Uncharacterized protein n=1 Tax=Vibrio paucivorans TaxID=2829489 RepID=A0A9X3CEA7_9VIBR|nr:MULTISPECIES: hypothetical protein [Vibrio]MCW8334143.1 hypothetical protein [Vibrio paucivorans]USD42932.1 hypothetical protein J4N42_20190 [Vibrio sp. SCSIO 43135]
MQPTTKQQVFLQLFFREQYGAPAVEVDGIDPEAANTTEYQQWLAEKAEITKQQVLESHWIKTCTEGYITELVFNQDGSLNEHKLFDRLHTQGTWSLVDGMLKVSITKGENRYEFHVVGRKAPRIYSAIEYKNGELHSYLKLAPVRPD